MDAPSDSRLLDLQRVGIRFGGLRAVSDLEIKLVPGCLHGLIGPNGAGKTTVFNLITGIYRPTEGDIHFDGTSLVGEAPDRIAKRGIGRTFQNIRIFAGMSVIENVKVAMYRHAAGSLWESVLRMPRYWRDEATIHREATQLLDTFGLLSVADLGAEQLPYGARRRLEIARALATRPKLLLLDEPAAGMNPSEAHDLMNLVRWVRDSFGVSILLIEHHMPVVMGICERITVLDQGASIAEGSPREIQNDPLVIEAYLGADVEARG